MSTHIWDLFRISLRAVKLLLAFVLCKYIVNSVHATLVYALVSHSDVALLRALKDRSLEKV